MMEPVSKLILLGVPRADIQCPYCGKTLHQTVYKGSSLTVYTPYFEECDCPEAVEHRSADEQEKKRWEAEEKNRKHRETVDRLLRSSGIRGRYLEKSLDNFTPTAENERAFKAVLKYVQKFPEFKKSGKGLYLTGPFGVGKTHLATGIARALIEQEYRVICKPSVTMLADIRATYDNTGDRSEYELLHDYLQADLLIIDDLGKELITDWSLSILYTILNMRYEDCRPLIITTNYSDTELIGRLSRRGDEKTAASMVSRLHEISFDIPVGGFDHRSQ